MGSILAGINSSQDIKKLNNQELGILSDEIREFLVDKVSKTGGHLASNLGVVELTISLHSVFNTPQDKIIWDVGHQSYVHKIITGRKDRFDTLRQFGGISGFPKVKESPNDIFDTGHSSTSISAALGYARARDIKGENYSVIAVIGDGALTGGMAFEALNDAGRSPNNLIVILNDNEMSISKNVGGLSSYLSRIRTEPVYFKVREDIDFLLNKIPAIGKGAAKVLDKAKGSIKYLLLPGAIFEELGFKYIGPIDGHNIAGLKRVFSRAKSMKGPIFIHVYTCKGKGYPFAEQSPHLFHGIAPFDVETGEVTCESSIDYSGIFGDALVDIAKEDKAVVAITAAMPQGTGLSRFSRLFPERFFDVGIAEQHAVTLAAGMAANGLKPVFTVYSSFLQRAYDQILHDVAIQNHHVVFAVDRAGIVGCDGETHQGVFDLSYLLHIPNMTVMAPKNYDELRKMLKFAVEQCDGPVAIRYPRGVCSSSAEVSHEIIYGRAEKLKQGKDLTIAAIGSMVPAAMKVSEILEKNGYAAEVINARFAKPIDEKMILESAVKTGKLFTMEDNVIKGGFGMAVLESVNRSNISCITHIFGFGDEFIVHGAKNELYKKYRLDAESIAGTIIKKL